MRRSYLDYAMSVIVARALPDVRDGLKPVHRRILCSACTRPATRPIGLSQIARDRRRRDGQIPPARRLGDLRRMVRMAQSFSMRVTLVDGQGNFGSVDGDPPAAMRYTEGAARKFAAMSAAGRHRQGHRRFSAELRRDGKRAERFCRRASPIC
jgi:DNA gyrase subunit A